VLIDSRASSQVLARENKEVEKLPRGEGRGSFSSLFVLFALQMYKKFGVFHAMLGTFL